MQIDPADVDAKIGEVAARRQQQAELDLRQRLTVGYIERVPPPPEPILKRRPR